VLSEVRRSTRLEGKSRGFKCDMGNQEKDCFCCSVEPPTFSSKAIRNLEKEFCKILAGRMSKEELLKKPLIKKGASTVQIGRGRKKGDKSNEDKKSKKSEKE
jgi:hypothetical protein